jgi:hypothetical protein
VAGGEPAAPGQGGEDLGPAELGEGAVVAHGVGAVLPRPAAPRHRGVAARAAAGIMRR